MTNALPISDITFHTLVVGYFLLATFVVLLFSPWLERQIRK